MMVASMNRYQGEASGTDPCGPSFQFNLYGKLLRNFLAAEGADDNHWASPFLGHSYRNESRP